MSIRFLPSKLQVPVLLRWADQACCAAVLVLSLAGIGLCLIYQGALSGRFIDIEKADQQLVEFRIDINEAQWPEWSVLPGIGEMLAKRIVESRRVEGPFRTIDDLDRVRGIGPKTLDGIRVYLLPVEKFPADEHSPATH